MGRGDWVINDLDVPVGSRQWVWAVKAKELMGCEIW